MIEAFLTPLVPERFLNDSRYHDGHIRVINPLPGVRILGVHIPDLRTLAQRMVNEGKALPLVRAFKKIQEEQPRSGLCYEEKMVWGMMLNRIPCTLEERLEHFQDFIPVIDNWAVCDIVCADAKWCTKHQKEVWNFLQPYFRSDKEFEVRFALVMSLSHFLTDDYIGLIFNRIMGLNYARIESEYTPSRTQGKAQPYYVNMAVAWLMATALYKFLDKTREFASKRGLPESIIKLYIRKVKESFRTRGMNPFQANGHKDGS